MATTWHKTGDTLPVLDGTLEDSSGTPLSIVGAEVELIVRLLRSDEVLLWVAAENLDDGQPENVGKVSYAWQPGDTDLPGGYRYEWRVTYTNGEILSFPNAGYNTLAIVESLTEASS